jgi:FkbM family methyltransferase
MPARLITGQTCYVDARSVVGQGLLVVGETDPKLGEWISSAVAGRDGIFVDAGANVGFFSLLALSKMRSGAAHAFEIDPRTVRCLRLTKSHGKMDNLIVHDCGLGAENARAGLVSEEELVWTHVDFAAQSGSGFVIRPLDDFASEFAGQRVIAMKVDVEGMELAVMQGAKNVLLKHRPVVVSEAIDGNMARYGASVRELIEFMASIGYSGQWLEKTNDPTLVFTPGSE